MPVEPLIACPSGGAPYRFNKRSTTLVSVFTRSAVYSPALVWSAEKRRQSQPVLQTAHSTPTTKAQRLPVCGRAALRARLWRARRAIQQALGHEPIQALAPRWSSRSC